MEKKRSKEGVVRMQEKKNAARTWAATQRRALVGDWSIASFWRVDPCRGSLARMLAPCPVPPLRIVPLVLWGTLLLALPPTLARAQGPASTEGEPSEVEASSESEPPEDARSDETVIDPETGRRYRVRHPEEALRRGPLPVASWVPVTLGIVTAGAAVAIAVLWFLLRRRRS